MEVVTSSDTVSIGVQKFRWQAVKVELRFVSDEAVAKLLLDLYCSLIQPRVELEVGFVKPNNSETEPKAENDDDVSIKPESGDLETDNTLMTFPVPSIHPADLQTSLSVKKPLEDFDDTSERTHDITGASDLDSPVSKEPEKRGKGRPRKQLSLDELSALESVEKAEKRPRGRPRKQSSLVELPASKPEECPNTDSLPTQSADTETASTDSKKDDGDELQVGQPQMEPVDKDHRLATLPQTTPPTVTSPTKPRSRRKRQNPVSVLNFSDPEETLEDEGDEGAGDPIFKSKLGRKRKGDEGDGDPDFKLKQPRKRKQRNGLRIIMQHFKKVEGIEHLACKQCEKIFDPKMNSLSLHLKREHGLVAASDGKTLRPLKCCHDSCQEITFSTFADYELHWKDLHGTDTTIDPERDVDRSSKVVCDLCGKTFKSARQLPAHYNKTHGKGQEKVTCPHPGCEKVLPKSHMGNHVRSKHKPVNCPYPECNQVMTIGRMKTHLQKHRLHLRPKLKCPHCDLTVTHKKASLARHILEVHNLEKRFECPEFGCKMTFKRIKTLKQHQRAHLNLKPFQCKWCDFSGVQQNNIRSHASTTHPEEFSAAQERNERYWIGEGAV